jgi:hypothetical protein
VDDFGNDFPHEQNNYGPGAFIGRDNYGDISYEMVDPQTKSMLAKLSEDAPDLAKLLREALNDGVISPDVAEALMFAVRNINEDVAEALLVAGHNINADVASVLESAGQNINRDVAAEILQAAQTLSGVRRELNHSLSSLDQTVGRVNSESGLGHLAAIAGAIITAAERIECAVTPPRPRKIALIKAFLLGFAIGVLVLFILYIVKPF